VVLAVGPEAEAARLAVLVEVVPEPVAKADRAAGSAKGQVPVRDPATTHKAVPGEAVAGMVESVDQEMHPEVAGGRAMRAPPQAVPYPEPLWRATEPEILQDDYPLRQGTVARVRKSRLRRAVRQRLPEIRRILPLPMRR
jgi:hypothetical protein